MASTWPGVIWKGLFFQPLQEQYLGQLHRVSSGKAEKVKNLAGYYDGRPAQRIVLALASTAEVEELFRDGLPFVNEGWLKSKVRLCWEVSI